MIRVCFEKELPRSYFDIEGIEHVSTKSCAADRENRADYLKGPGDVAFNENIIWLDIQNLG